MPGRARSSQAGFTVIEVMVAMTLMVVGMLATFLTLNSASHLTVTTQREQAAMTVAEQTLEQLHAMSYTNLALASTPAHSTDGNGTGDTSGNPSNPNYWISGGNLLVVSNFNQETSPTLPGVATTGEPIVSGGTVSPSSTVSTGGYTATVSTYISWVNDTCVYQSSDLCPGAQDAKRVTVAVVLNSGAEVGVQKPVWLSTVVADPRAGLGP